MPDSEQSKASTRADAAPAGTHTRSMMTTEIHEIERALQAIELILADRCRADGFAPRNAPSNVVDLPAPAKEIDARSGQESKAASPEREAIHCCLTSAATLLDVTRRLMTEPVGSRKDRTERLRTLVADMRTGGRIAFHAGLVLLGQDASLAGPAHTPPPARGGGQ